MYFLSLFAGKMSKASAETDQMMEEVSLLVFSQHTQMI